MADSWRPWTLLQRTNRTKGVLSFGVLLSLYYRNFHIANNCLLEELLGSRVTANLGEEFLLCFVVATLFDKYKIPLGWKEKLEEFYRGL